MGEFQSYVRILHGLLVPSIEVQTFKSSLPKTVFRVATVKVRGRGVEGTENLITWFFIISLVASPLVVVCLDRFLVDKREARKLAKDFEEATPVLTDVTLKPTHNSWSLPFEVENYIQVTYRCKEGRLSIVTYEPVINARGNLEIKEVRHEDRYPNSD